MAILTVDQVKEYLRYDAADTSNDDALAIIVDAGQRWIENYTGHVLVQRAVTETLGSFETGIPITLRYKPFDTVTGATIAYSDADLASQDFDAFGVYPYYGAHRLSPTTSWPTGSGVTVSYTAGYESADDVPEDLLHALCIYAAMSDQERASPDNAAWMALDHILTHYRLPVLA